MERWSGGVVPVLRSSPFALPPTPRLRRTSRASEDRSSYGGSPLRCERDGVPTRFASSSRVAGRDLLRHLRFAASLRSMVKGVGLSFPRTGCFPGLSAVECKHFFLHRIFARILVVGFWGVFALQSAQRAPGVVHPFGACAISALPRYVPVVIVFCARRGRTPRSPLRPSRKPTPGPTRATGANEA